MSKTLAKSVKTSASGRIVAHHIGAGSRKWALWLDGVEIGTFNSRDVESVMAEYEASLDKLAFQLTQATQHETVYFNAKPVASIQRRSVHEANGPAWKAYNLRGELIARCWHANPEKAREILSRRIRQGLANGLANTDAQQEIREDAGIIEPEAAQTQSDAEALFSTSETGTFGIEFVWKNGTLETCTGTLGKPLRYDTLAQAMRSAFAFNRDHPAALNDSGFFRALTLGKPQAETPKTPGQIAYETDCAARPLYDDKTPRKSWAQLDDITRYSWERDPTPRWTVETPHAPVAAGDRDAFNEAREAFRAGPTPHKAANYLDAARKAHRTGDIGNIAMQDASEDVAAFLRIAPATLTRSAP